MADLGLDEIPYDDSDIDSVVAYAECAVGKSLRKILGVDSLDDPRVKRGAFGSALETLYFKIPANNLAGADFEKINVELKSTPMVRKEKGAYTAKERLVLSMINYDKLVDEEWQSSHLLEKVRQMLLVAYLFEKGKNPVDYKILLAKLWKLSNEDLAQFQSDWELIRSKVQSGQAHMISCSDTMYLEACTKAANGKVTRRQPFSDILAKPRAWAFKRSYIDVVLNGMLNAQNIARRESEKDLDLLELVRKRFLPYRGKLLTDMAAKLGYPVGSKLPKNIGNMIARSILGVNEKTEIAEFRKAGIMPKVIRLERTGRPREAVSFSTFSYDLLLEQEFEDSAFSEQLGRKYLFVIFKEDEEVRGQYRFADVLFWQMPDADLAEAKACYELMRQRVKEGNASRSVTSKENRCCHVRPKARDGRDTVVTPMGEHVVKKCFWLNQKYLRSEIARELPK